MKMNLRRQNFGQNVSRTFTKKEYLKDKYLVVSMDFQSISIEEFADTQTFV